MTPKVTPINFSDTAPSHYTGFYATVLDDVFNTEECKSRLERAAAESNQWSPAGMSGEGPTQTVHSNFRNSERILYIDAETADMIYERLRPLVENEIGEIAVSSQWDGITGKKGRKQGPKWTLVGVPVNPRLSFLRYGPGHYFKPHCDGLKDLVREGGTVHKSFVTLNLNLNGNGAPQELSVSRHFRSLCS